MKRIIYLVTILLVTCSLLIADGYKVTKVVEVGPAAWIPFTGPIKWSPDGENIAYFANNYLMISDTLGIRQEILYIDSGITPRRFEWVSDEDIAINLPKYTELDSNFINSIILVNISNKQVTSIAEWYDVSRSPGNTFYEGPFLSLEGNAYYLQKTTTGRTKIAPSGRSQVAETIDNAQWLLPEKSSFDKDNHCVRWFLDSGLYKIDLFGKDSTRITPTLFRHIGPFTAVNSDLSWVSNGGTLIRIADSTCIVMDTIPMQLPDNVVSCGILFTSFNPKASEILFNQSCDGEYPSGEELVVDRIGTFNYTTNEFIILDTLIGIESCTAPVYNPDGKKIAFLDNDDYRVYIIYREGR